jgi:hypothetical protein
MVVVTWVLFELVYPEHIKDLPMLVFTLDLVDLLYKIFPKSVWKLQLVNGLTERLRHSVDVIVSKKKSLRKGLPASVSLYAFVTKSQLGQRASASVMCINLSIAMLVVVGSISLSARTHKSISSLSRASLSLITGTPGSPLSVSDAAVRFGRRYRSLRRRCRSLPWRSYQIQASLRSVLPGLLFRS